AALQHLPEALQKLKGSPGIIAFFEPFFHYRVANAHCLTKLYPMMSLLTPAMMDTDCWFHHRPLRPMHESTPLAPQIEIYEKIAQILNGKVLPFIAFDPRRQVEWIIRPDDGPSPLDQIKASLGRNGLAGVKLYPPMGYRPADNVSRDSKPNNDWWNGLGSAMDSVLLDLFSQCSKWELPVMAHTNQSHGSEKRYESNGNPDNWRIALAKTPALKINLAHF